MRTFLTRLTVLLVAALAFAPYSGFAQGITAHADHDHVAALVETDVADVETVDLRQTPGAFATTSLTLPAGKYCFRVANDGVDHEVGFVIQRAADRDGDVMATALANSFTASTIPDGASSETGVVELTPGAYVYSCPLNPTPHYTITVE